MPRENAIQARVRKQLEALAPRAKCIRTCGEGEPDLICSIRGRLVAVEVKQPGKKPEPLQRARLVEWNTSGAIAAWTDGNDWYGIYGSGEEFTISLSRLKEAIE